MAAMFVAALAVPEAFGRHGVVLGVAFLIVAVMQVALYALSARGDRALFKANPWEPSLRPRGRIADCRRRLRARRGRSACRSPRPDDLASLAYAPYVR
jgi:hypothetical protein